VIEVYALLTFAEIHIEGGDAEVVEEYGVVAS